MKQIKSEVENGRLKGQTVNVLAFEDGAEFEAYYKEHGGEIVAIQQVSDTESYCYFGKYTVNNIGYEVPTEHGIERAFKITDQNGTFIWGVLNDCKSYIEL